jgi:hypothetical protein
LICSRCTTIVVGDVRDANTWDETVAGRGGIVTGAGKIVAVIDGKEIGEGGGETSVRQ